MDDHGKGPLGRAARQARQAPGPLGAAALVLAAATLLPGCKRQSGENFGLLETAPVVSATPSGAELTRADLLLQLLSLSHAEVTARLGPHRIESQTQWSITPVVTPGSGSGPAAGPGAVRPGFKVDSPAQPYDGGAAWESTAVTLEETRSIAVDAAGRLQLASQNDHGTGVEAVLDQNFLYLRMRYAPYIRYKPEGDQVARLRATAYESGAALLETVAPYVRLSAPVEATALGRPAWQVTLARQDAAGGGRDKRAAGAGSLWRAATAVDMLNGTVTIDRQKGTLLNLQLHVRFVAPRPDSAASGGERVQVEAEHQVRVVALDKDVPAIVAPADWIDPPSRPRPMLDRQELLNGLSPGRP
jgi:hypothetical protein